MPKFHLNIEGGATTATDDRGLDAPSLEDARAAAQSRLDNAAEASAASQYPIEAVVITTTPGASS